MCSRFEPIPSYYQKGTHRNTHQNGTLILSKWNTHQKWNTHKKELKNVKFSNMELSIIFASARNSSK